MNKTLLLATTIILTQGGNRTAGYYGYFERGRWLASDYGHKLGIAYDRLLTKRTVAPWYA